MSSPHADRSPLLPPFSRDWDKYCALPPPGPVHALPANADRSPLPLSSHSLQGLGQVLRHGALEDHPLRVLKSLLTQLEEGGEISATMRTEEPAPAGVGFRKGSGWRRDGCIRCSFTQLNGYKEVESARGPGRCGVVSHFDGDASPLMGPACLNPRLDCAGVGLGWFTRCLVVANTRLTC